MPADDRDRTRQQGPGGPYVRDPYGRGELNSGGTVLGSWSHLGGSSYGFGSNNYGSGQAAIAYERARQAQERATELGNQRYTLSGHPAPVDDTYSRDGFDDYGRGDRANSEASDYPNRPAGSGPTTVDGNGNVIPPQGGSGSTTAQGQTPGATDPNLPQGPGGPGAPGGGASWTSLTHQGSSGGGGGDYSYQQDPEMKAQLMGVIDMLKKQGMGDMEAQRAALDWYNKQHGQADADHAKMTEWTDAVLRQGKYAGRSFDPNADANSFAGIAPDVENIQKSVDERLKQLDESTLDPATKMRMREEIINTGYSAKAAVGQEQIKDARGYIAHDQDRASAVSQAPILNGAANAAGASNANLSLQAGADLQGRGQNLQRDQFNSELEYRQAKDAQDEAFRRAQLGQSGSQFDRDLQLRQQQLQMQQNAGKTNWLSSFGNLLSKLKMPGGGNSGSGSGFGGGTGGSSNANWGTNSWDGGTQVKSGQGSGQGQFLQEDGSYGRSSGNTGAGWDQDAWASGQYD